MYVWLFNVIEINEKIITVIFFNIHITAIFTG
jgi:hypothetical protein